MEEQIRCTSESFILYTNVMKNQKTREELEEEIAMWKYLYNKSQDTIQQLLEKDMGTTYVAGVDPYKDSNKLYLSDIKIFKRDAE